MYNKLKQFISNKQIVAFIVAIGIVFGIVGCSNNDTKFTDAITQADKSFSDEHYSEAEKEYQTALSYKEDDSVKEKVTLCEKLDNSLNNYNKGIT